MSHLVPTMTVSKMLFVWSHFYMAGLDPILVSFFLPALLYQTLASLELAKFIAKMGEV
jgi:hypothetical protein